MSSVHLLPESRSAVLVLTNSLANNDAADWLGELLLETVLDNPIKNDYIQSAQLSVEESRQRWPRMRQELESKRIPDTAVRKLDVYCGAYYNVVGKYHLESFLDEDLLKMCFQGDRRYTYELTHYHYDTLSWLLTRDEDVRHGLVPVTRSSFYLLAFASGAENESDSIDQLIWINDAAIPDGETFCKSWDRQRLAAGQTEPSVEGPS